MTEIVWEEPPGHGAGNATVDHFEIAAMLRSNPGCWAKIVTDGHASMQSAISKARIAAYRPEGSFEAVGRNGRIVDGRSSKVFDIYARYIGDGST